MRYIALILMLIAPSWAVATQRSYICTAKVAIGWKAKSEINSVGNVTTENQWLLSAVNEIAVNFSEPQKEPMTASYALRFLGEEDVKGYCSYYISDDKNYEAANCHFLSVLKKHKGSLSHLHPFDMEQNLEDDLTYQRLDNAAFFSGYFSGGSTEVNVAYEQGSCKSF